MFNAFAITSSRLYLDLRAYFSYSVKIRLDYEKTYCKHGRLSGTFEQYPTFLQVLFIILGVYLIYCPNSIVMDVKRQQKKSSLHCS